MSEGGYLDFCSDDGAEDYLREKGEERYYASVDGMRSRYQDNKASQIGTTIRCACCNKRILKKSYQTQFCSNKGVSNCKDTYWNNVSDKRRERSCGYTNY